ncbi:MAG: zf-HC2 domain-containing protein [Gemmatimonadota bacterium]
MTTGDESGILAGDGPGAGEQACAWTRDRIPLRGLQGLSRSELAELEVHLLRCGDCRAEAELVETLQASSPEPPPSILVGVLEARAARNDSHGSDWRRWVIRSAAVLVLALGASVIWSRDGGTDAVWALALETEPPAWYGSDWVVAGQPIPEGLPDEVLRGLLEEIDP